MMDEEVVSGLSKGEDDKRPTLAKMLPKLLYLSVLLSSIISYPYHHRSSYFIQLVHGIGTPRGSHRLHSQHSMVSALIYLT